MCGKPNFTKQGVTLDVIKGTSETSSPAECIVKCKDHHYAGVQTGSFCFCGDTLPPLSKLRQSTECNIICSGDASQTCGGVQRANVYVTQSLLNFLYFCINLSFPEGTFPEVYTISSSGPATQLHPEKMGNYSRMPWVSINGKPVWKKLGDVEPQFNYLYYTDNAYWMIGTDFNSNMGHISASHNNLNRILPLHIGDC